jgi:regulator of protease activity HflC (stomatin/prohibitin superfamily)
VVLFVLSIVVMLLSIGWFLFATSKDYDGNNWKPYGFIGVGLSLVLLLLSCFAVVGAKNVGVPTVFGKPTGETFNSGLNFKAPWVNVTDIDGTVKIREYFGDDCIKVKISDAGSACVSLSYRWRINPDGADVVYTDYRKSEDGIEEGVRKALVSTNIKAAINEVFGEYDPMQGAVITPDMTPQQVAALKITLPNLEEFNQKIKDNVEQKIENLGDLIDIQSVTISYLSLPTGTQERIDRINAKVADTKLAIADISIKKAQADANKELAASLQDPNVLVSKCLDGLIEGEIKAPAGFQCFPNSGSSVVIPSSN